MSAINYHTSFSCPGCGFAETPKLALPVAICCSNCRAVFSALADQQVEDNGLKWTVTNEISIIKLGTKGVFKGRSFEIIGRARSVTSMATSNEWLMDFGDKTYAWLTESNSSYFVFETKALPLGIPDIKSKQAGHVIRLNQRDYAITEISKQVAFALEGQIPYEAYNDEDYFKYELKASNNDGYATICIFDKNKVEAFTGDKIKPEDLKLSNINEYSDWK